MLNALLTLGTAAWAARKVGKKAVTHGTLIGLISSLIILGLGLIFGLRFRLMGTAQEKWNLAMLVLAIGSGWLGGSNARAALCRQEALYATSRAISTAHSHQAIVDAIGQHLVSSDVGHITLWQAGQVQDGEPVKVHLLAAWASSGTQAPPSGLALDSNELLSLVRLRGNEPLSIRSSRVSRAERAVWQRLGVRSALLVPLTDARETLIGLLAIASSTGQGPKREFWPARLFGPQVALALENLRLVEEARQAAVLGERQRMAREIHDTLAQGFTSIVMHLEAAEQALSARQDPVRQDPGGQNPARQHIDQAKGMAREGLGQARKLVWALRPDILEGTTLSAALERAATQWKKDNDVAANVIATGMAYPLPPDTEVMLLRVMQEALRNVHKHAQAKQVTVTLSYMNDMVVLDVQDDGRGFDPQGAQALPAASDTGGFGLTAMRERVEQLGGTLFIESVPGEGTTVVVEIPAQAET